jgi:hypothetical protein
MEIAVPYDRAEALTTFLRDATAGQLILQGTWMGDVYL